MIYIDCDAFRDNSTALFIGAYAMFAILNQLQIPSRGVHRSAFHFLAVVRAHPSTAIQCMPLPLQCLHVLRRVCAEAHFFVMFNDLLAAAAAAAAAKSGEVGCEVYDAGGAGAGAGACTAEELQHTYDTLFCPQTNIAFSQLVHLLRYCYAWWD